jgi:hypothetical protein
MARPSTKRAIAISFSAKFSLAKITRAVRLSFTRVLTEVFNAAVALVEAERFLRQTTREKETDRDSNLDLLADVSIPLAHLR